MSFPPAAALRAAILDLDGTLVDTLGDFHAALNHMLLELQLPAVSAEAVAGFIGKGSEHLIRQTLAHVGGLAVRPDDGAIFASGGGAGDIYRLTPAGVETLVGLTGVGGVGDLAFSPAVIPEPAGLTLLAAAGLSLLGFSRRRRAA